MQKTLSKEDVQKLFKLIDFDTDDEQSLEIFIDFANVVAAAEREKVADWMMARAYATGHGESIEELLQELEWQIRENEREACAKILDEMAAKDKLSNYYVVAALAIRARGQG